MNTNRYSALDFKRLFLDFIFTNSFFGYYCFGLLPAFYLQTIQIFYNPFYAATRRPYFSLFCILHFSTRSIPISAKLFPVLVPVMKGLFNIVIVSFLFNIFCSLYH